MTEKARRGTRVVLVKMALVEEEYNERGEVKAFSVLKASLVLHRQGMPLAFVEMRC